MGFGFGGKKGNSRRRLGSGALRPIGRRVRPIGDGVQPIDTPIKAVDTAVSGTSGVRGRVGKKVRSIDKPVKNIFDPLS